MSSCLGAAVPIGTDWIRWEKGKEGRVRSGSGSGSGSGRGIGGWLSDDDCSCYPVESTEAGDGVAGMLWKRHATAHCLKGNGGGRRDWLQGQQKKGNNRYSEADRGSHTEKEIKIRVQWMCELIYESTKEMAWRRQNTWLKGHTYIRHIEKCKQALELEDRKTLVDRCRFACRWYK